MPCTACSCDKAVCLVTSGLLAGVGTTLTLVSVPSLNATTDALPAWKRVYKNGSKMAVSLILTTTGLAVRLFYKYEDTRYLCVAGTTALFIPYTLLFMKPTNDALFAIEDESARNSDQEESKVRKLIAKWDKLQYGRTALGIVAFCLNAWIVTKKLKN